MKRICKFRTRLLGAVLALAVVGTASAPALAAEKLPFGRWWLQTESRTAADGSIRTEAKLMYDGSGPAVTVLSFEKMERASWDKLQDEAGPHGLKLGETPDGSVVVLNTLQSNPFAPGTAEYELFQKMPRLFDLLSESALLFRSEELGFQVKLPALLRGHWTAEFSERTAYGEPVRGVNILYEGAQQTVCVLSFEEMSQTVWQKMQAEGGPLGTELGVSEDGRVVVSSSLQSNPFAPGTDDYELFESFPAQLGIVTDTFHFLR